MMDTSKEQIKGWIGSLVFHALLLLVFFFVQVPEILQQEEFVEVSWGGVTSIAQAAPSSSPSKAELTERSAVNLNKLTEPSQTISPPERRMLDLSNETIQVPKTEKLTSLEANANSARSRNTAAGDRDAGGKKSLGEKETDASGGLGGISGAATPSAGLHAGSGTIDRGVSFNIQWLEGGTRKKISGDLPKYPQGVNVEAQIKVLAVILPDGTVKMLQPAQKGNTRLEDAAMKEVRYWRFEHLRKSQPQLEQRCEITFLFTLK